MLIYISLLAGLVLLFVGGDWLVKGASAIAARLHVPPMIVGLTIVGFGTSTPELLVSLEAALSGQSGIAIGNVIGSNIANILLIGGVTALVAPLLTPFAPLKRDLTVMICATLALPLVLWSGSIGAIEGSLLLVSIRNIDRSSPAVPTSVSTAKSIGLMLLGLGALVYGADLLVGSASTLARTFGISEAMIGLSIVAVGTSLPELATSLTAALRGQRDIAIGNIIGSNIFNLLFILGLTAVISPIPVAARFLPVDTPVVLLATLFLGALVALKGQINRPTGAIMLLSYLGYIGLTAQL